MCQWMRVGVYYNGYDTKVLYLFCKHFAMSSEDSPASSAPEGMSMISDSRELLLVLDLHELNDDMNDNTNEDTSNPSSSFVFVYNDSLLSYGICPNHTHISQFNPMDLFPSFTMQSIVRLSKSVASVCTISSLIEQMTSNNAPNNSYHVSSSMNVPDDFDQLQASMVWGLPFHASTYPIVSSIDTTIDSYSKVLLFYWRVHDPDLACTQCGSASSQRFMTMAPTGVMCARCTSCMADGYVSCSCCGIPLARPTEGSTSMENAPHSRVRLRDEGTLLLDLCACCACAMDQSPETVDTVRGVRKFCMMTHTKQWIVLRMALNTIMGALSLTTMTTFGAGHHLYLSWVYVIHGFISAMGRHYSNNADEANDVAIVVERSGNGCATPSDIANLQSEFNMHHQEELSRYQSFMHSTTDLDEEEV